LDGLGDGDVEEAAGLDNHHSVLDGTVDSALHRGGRGDVCLVEDELGGTGSAVVGGGHICVVGRSGDVV
jgi:hypothetical protein